MHILSLCNGSLQGNSEILLKAALLSAQASSPSPDSTSISWLHVPSLLIPPNAPALEGAQDISAGQNLSNMNTHSASSPSATAAAAASILPVDDRRAALGAILSADALIVASAVYSHQPAAALKALMDRVGGPFLDVGFAKLVSEGKAAGDPRFKDAPPPDPSLSKPRVVGLMAAAGATQPDQTGLALPVMQSYFYPLGARVVDMVLFPGVANPGAVLLEKRTEEGEKDGGGGGKGGKEKPVDRAARLGRNVGSQLGKAYDEVRFMGDETRWGGRGVREGLACPFCHLSVVEMFHTANNDVGCVTCGAKGRLVVGEGGRVVPEWDGDGVWSCMTMEGKVRHAQEIMQWTGREMPRMAEVQSERQKWIDLDIPMVPLPSQNRGS